ncbi:MULTISPECIES: hypothetical protein [Bradyrhizobium]|uniref:hypothetical protein n=1 Tax=Bradyrhizobium elkanii TaxID=29448 RepID=UPI00040CF88E|nr:hypothetical protein [Bradyrhizobium elkanii]
MSDKEEQKRIQEKQGGHHMPPRPDDGPPLDDTDRNTDKVIKPSRRKPEPYARAFSSEVDIGSREENASKQESRASVLIQSEQKML